MNPVDSYFDGRTGVSTKNAYRGAGLEPPIPIKLRIMTFVSGIEIGRAFNDF